MWHVLLTEAKVKRLPVWNMTEVIYTLVLGRASVMDVHSAAAVKPLTRNRGFGIDGWKDTEDAEEFGLCVNY